MTGGRGSGRRAARGGGGRTARKVCVPGIPLNILQALGLAYGDKITAGEFYRLALERIPRVEWVCALDNANLPPHSLWWNACDANQPQVQYEKGRNQILKKMS